MKQEEALLSRLRAFGCDVVGAMNRMLNDTDFYYDCLTSFAEDPLFTALGTAIEAGDVRKAFEHAHALKGVAANLGLTPLCSIVNAMVALLRAGTLDGTQALYGELMSARESLKECL